MLRKISHILSKQFFPLFSGKEMSFSKTLCPPSDILNCICKLSLPCPAMHSPTD